MCLSGIKFTYYDKIPYCPTVSWEKLDKTINQQKTIINNTWDWNGLYDDNYRFFNDFLYYVLKRNIEANALFDTFSPTGAAHSESVEYLYRKAVRSSLENYHTNQK